MTRSACNALRNCRSVFYVDLAEYIQYLEVLLPALISSRRPYRATIRIPWRWM